MRAEEGIFFHGSPAPFFSDFLLTPVSAHFAGGGPFFGPILWSKNISEKPSLQNRCIIL